MTVNFGAVMDFSRVSVYRNIKYETEYGDKQCGGKDDQALIRESLKIIFVSPILMLSAVLQWKDGNHVLSKAFRRHILRPDLDGYRISVCYLKALSRQ